MIKHGFIEDADLLHRIQQYNGYMADNEFLQEVTTKTVALKTCLVNGDVADLLNEMIPQYGHAIGHAVEAASEYQLLHGEAIGIGMCATAHIAYERGLCDASTVSTHHQILRKFELPTFPPAWMSLDDIIGALRYDKHYVGRAQMVLPAALGRHASVDGRTVFDVADAEVRTALLASKDWAAA